MNFTVICDNGDPDVSFLCKQNGSRRQRTKNMQVSS